MWKLYYQGSVGGQAILGIPVARRLKLYWGVRPVVSDLEDLRALEQPIRSAIELSPRAVVVFININPDLSRSDANYLRIERL